MKIIKFKIPIGDERTIAPGMVAESKLAVVIAPNEQEAREILAAFCEASKQNQWHHVADVEIADIDHAEVFAYAG